MLAAELINQLFDQAGVTDQKEVQDKLAQVKDLASIDIPDDVAGKLIGNDRMSLEAAKNNSDLKKYFTALALNGVDAEVNNAITKYGLNPDDFKDENSSYKKIGMSIEKLEEKLKSELGKGKTDNKELIDQINQLKTERANVEQDYQKKIEQMQADHNGQLDKMAVGNILRGYKYGTQLGMDDNVLIAENKIHSELASKGLKYVRNNGSFELQKEDGTKYFEGSKEVTFKDFTEKVLAANNLLAANDNQQSQPATTATNTASSNGSDKGWGDYAAKANAALEAAK